MRLSAWLRDKGVKRRDFAARIGVSPSYITALCGGTVWPGRDVANRISDETGGAVTANDFLGGEGAESDAAPSDTHRDAPASARAGAQPQAEKPEAA